MSIEERKKALSKLGRKLTYSDYREMMIDWEIADVNEFLTTKGTRLNTENLRLKKESHIRVILLCRINRTLRIKESGIKFGQLDYGGYLRTKHHREQDRKRREKEQEAE